MKATITLKSVAAIASLSLAIPGLNINSAASANTEIPVNLQGHKQELTSSRYEDKNEFRVTTALTNCRRVNTRGSYLNVRSTPGGQIIGSSRNRSVVRIVNRGENGWVPISDPFEGYVSSRYLGYCR